MKLSNHGSAWLEVLLAVAVLGILLVGGMAGLNGMLEQFQKSLLWELEQREIHNLGSRIQRMMDQGAENIFHTGPFIEGEQLPDGWELAEYTIEWFDGDGLAREWKLRLSNGQWVETDLHSEGQRDKRSLNYVGRIIILRANAEGARASRLSYWRFPDARLQRCKDGFAIHRFW